jgi:hypothetical protein
MQIEGSMPIDIASLVLEKCGAEIPWRGGVYRGVKEAMGGTLAKLSVSALIIDFTSAQSTFPCSSHL